MMRLESGLGAAMMAAAVIFLGAPSARADIILEQYEFQGQLGTETTLAPSFVATGVTGMNFGESAVLTPNAGGSSINTSGWNNPGAYYTFGLTVGAGLSVTVDQLILTSKSSATGPGFVNVLASVNGGAFTQVASITQPSTNYDDEFLAITPVTATRSLVFEVVAANQTSAGGGTIGSGGTFRMGDYNPAGTPTPFTLNGTITPAAPAAVPEPSALGLAAVGLVTAGVIRRARRRAR